MNSIECRLLHIAITILSFYFQEFWQAHEACQQWLSDKEAVVFKEEHPRLQVPDVIQQVFEAKASYKKDDLFNYALGDRYNCRFYIF